MSTETAEDRSQTTEGAFRRPPYRQIEPWSLVTDEYRSLYMNSPHFRTALQQTARTILPALIAGFAAQARDVDARRLAEVEMVNLRAFANVTEADVVRFLDVSSKPVQDARIPHRIGDRVVMRNPQDC